jgi:uncharacterized membrane protein
LSILIDNGLSNLSNGAERAVPAVGRGKLAARHTQGAAASKVPAANQGLYNGFLAAGLFWGLALQHRV